MPFTIIVEGVSGNFSFEEGRNKLLRISKVSTKVDGIIRDTQGVEVVIGINVKIFNSKIKKKLSYPNLESTIGQVPCNSSVFQFG